MWGSNEYGRLGLGKARLKEVVPTPTAVPLPEECGGVYALSSPYPNDKTNTSPNPGPVTNSSPDPNIMVAIRTLVLTLVLPVTLTLTLILIQAQTLSLTLRPL